MRLVLIGLSVVGGGYAATRCQIRWLEPTMPIMVRNDEDGVMAEPSEKGKYVKLTVHVWYDPHTKRVHVTSNDPDLPPGGLSTNFKPGTQAERATLALLAKYGKLPEGFIPPGSPEQAG